MASCRYVNSLGRTFWLHLQGMYNPRFHDLNIHQHRYEKLL